MRIPIVQPFAALVAICSLADAAHATVLHVKVGTQYSTIQSAVEAAANGDTILVDFDILGQAFDEDVVIDGKGLVLAAGSAQSSGIQVRSITIRNTTAAQAVSVIRFICLPVEPGSRGVSVTNCAGPVRLADVTTTGAAALNLTGGPAGAYIDNCAHFTMTGIAVGGPGHPATSPGVTNGGEGLYIRSSTAVLDVQALGGTGGGGALSGFGVAGGPGVRNIGSTILMGPPGATGGAGGDGTVLPGGGGPGLDQHGGTAATWLRQASLVGGAGGSDGLGHTGGSATVFDGSLGAIPVEWAYPTGFPVAYGGERLFLQFIAHRPDVEVWAFVGLDAVMVPIPSAAGFLLTTPLPGSAGLFPVGITAAIGDVYAVNLDTDVPAVPPGTELLLQIQAVVMDAGHPALCGVLPMPLLDG